MSTNVATMIGRLVADPESKTTKDGAEISKFRIAVNRDRKSDNGPEADFFGVTCFRQNAEFANRYFSKGNLICVTGRVEIDEYEDRDGNKRTAVGILADRVQNLTPKPEGDDDRRPARRDDERRPAPRGRDDRDDYDDEPRGRGRQEPPARRDDRR